MYEIPTCYLPVMDPAEKYIIHEQWHKKMFVDGKVRQSCGVIMTTANLILASDCNCTTVALECNFDLQAQL